MEFLHCAAMQDQPWFLRSYLGWHAQKEWDRLKSSNTEIFSYHFLVEDSAIPYSTISQHSRFWNRGVTKGNSVFQSIAPSCSRWEPWCHNIFVMIYLRDSPWQGSFTDVIGGRSIVPLPLVKWYEHLGDWIWLFTWLSFVICRDGFPCAGTSCRLFVIDGISFFFIIFFHILLHSSGKWQPTRGIRWCSRISLELQSRSVPNDTWPWLHVLGRASHVFGSILSEQTLHCLEAVCILGMLQHRQIHGPAHGLSRNVVQEKIFSTQTSSCASLDHSVVLWKRFENLSLWLRNRFSCAGTSMASGFVMTDKTSSQMFIPHRYWFFSCWTTHDQRFAEPTLHANPKMLRTGWRKRMCETTALHSTNHRHSDSIDNYPPFLLSRNLGPTHFVAHAGCPLSPWVSIIISAERIHWPSGLYVCVPYHFASVPGPKKDPCAFGNLCAWALNYVEFETHFLKFSSPFDQSMSLYVDMKMVRSLESSDLIPYGAIFSLNIVEQNPVLCVLGKNIPLELSTGPPSIPFNSC